MALVTWTDKLSVGVRSIDDQHTVLFGTINDLHAAMMKGQGRAIVGKLLCSLLVYTRNHFSAEEEMLAAVNYPRLPEHQIKHHGFTRQVEHYIVRYQRGDITLSHDLAALLSNWLKTHIEDLDQSYAPFVNKGGVR